MVLPDPTPLVTAEKSPPSIAVVGTGATGYQLVPELARLAGQVTLFQRKPQWVFPLPGYLHRLPPQVLWLDRNLPFHLNFMRFRTNWLTGEKVYTPIFTADPGWQAYHAQHQAQEASQWDAEPVSR